MVAPKGHPIWGNPRKPKKYTPQKYWEGACKYFDWSIKNPIKIIEQSKMPQKLPSNYKKETHGPIKNFTKQVIELPHARAFSIERLCVFLNIHRSTFNNYLSGKGYETYFDISLRIKDIIDSQHFEGGMSGLFNAGIVTRKLGLAEKNDHTSSDGTMTPNIIVSSKKTEEELNKLISGD